MKTAKATRHSSRPKVKAKTKTKTKAKMKTRPKMKKARAKAAPRPRAMRKTAAKTKTKATMKKPVARAVHTPPMKPASNVTPIRDRMEGRVFNDSREYDRRVYVRFDAPGKELVKTAAGESGLSPYIAYFAAEAAKAGKKVVATPVTGKDQGVFARFETPAVKKMVAKAASECEVSLSAYAAYFALEAAKSDRKMPGAKKDETEAASA